MASSSDSVDKEDDLLAEFAASVGVSTEDTEENGSGKSEQELEQEKLELNEQGEEIKSSELEASDKEVSTATQSPAASSELADAESESPLEAGLDTEKMLEEMAALSEAQTQDNGTPALDEEIDTDKMAIEASKLSGES